MNKQLFRKTSIDRVSSPEQLNDYVRVAGPGIWMVLGAIIILLIGVGIWGVFGHLDTTLQTAGISSGGTFTCYVRESDLLSVQEGMTVKVEDQTARISQIASSPFVITGEMDSYLLHLAGLTPGEWIYAVNVDMHLQDGIYRAEITTESISPISFLLN